MSGPGGPRQGQQCRCPLGGAYRHAHTPPLLIPLERLDKLRNLAFVRPSGFAVDNFESSAFSTRPSFQLRRSGRISIVDAISLTGSFIASTHILDRSTELVYISGLARSSRVSIIIRGAAQLRAAPPESDS